MINHVMLIAFLINGDSAIVQTPIQKNSSSSQDVKTVLVQTVIGVDGIPFRPSIVRGIDAEKDKASLDAIRQWRFRPGIRNGKPVPVFAEVQIDFDSRGDSTTPQLSQAHGVHLPPAAKDQALLDYYVSRAEAGDTDSQIEASLRLSNVNTPADDLVRACAWAMIAAKDGTKRTAKLLAKVEKRTSASEMDAAHRAADEWRPGSPLMVKNN